MAMRPDTANFDSAQDFNEARQIGDILHPLVERIKSLHQWIMAIHEHPHLSQDAALVEELRRETTRIQEDTLGALLPCTERGAVMLGYAATVGFQPIYPDGSVHTEINWDELAEEVMADEKAHAEWEGVSE